MLLTTHYLEEADLLASRLIVLDRGVQVADGTPAALRDRVGADTLLVATLGRRDARLETDLETIPGVTHVAGEGEQLHVFARHRDGLIADITMRLLPFGLRDLTVDKPHLEQVIAALTEG